MDEEIKWPGAGQKLFQGPGRATFMTGGWVGISDGYHDAASILIDHLNANGRDDGLVPPILFLYRHYLEIALKEFIYMVHWCKDGQGKSPYGHGLDTCWEEFYGLVYERIEGEGEEEVERLNAVGSIVREMQEFDPGSFTARYHVADATRQFNFSPSELQDTMQRVNNWLSSAYDWWCNGEGPPVIRDARPESRKKKSS